MLHALNVTNLAAGYGSKPVLHGVSLNVLPGEIVAVIGHNGAGKSTLLKTIVGLLPKSRGDVVLADGPVGSSRPDELLARGLGYVPQGNRVFACLTVEDNLKIGGYLLGSPSRIRTAMDRVFEIFPELPQLVSRQAGALSGGEKQIVALARALMLSPRVLLLDEPSIGLSPWLVGATLSRLREVSHECGCAMLIVEQKVREVLAASARVYVLRNGSVSFSGRSEELSGDDEKLRAAFL
jgi:branched-chain amino acid transport system ATP-binding protein